MKRILASLIAFAVLTAAPLASVAATFFSDNFSNGSTLNGTSAPGGTPTASFTSYDVASTKNATACTIAANDLALKLNATTSSGFWEAQALFSANPIALSVVGDYIDITVVFTNTIGTLLAQSTGSYLWLGLYGSGGSAPVAGGLANAGLTTATGSSYATGNCQNWLGYVARVSNGGNSQIITRPAQTGSGTSSANQDLVGNNVGGGAYNNPTGTSLANAVRPAVTLTSGGLYSLYLHITLSAANTLTVSNALFEGAGTGGTMLLSQMGSTTNPLTAGFDGLAIGARHSGGSPNQNPTMDVSSILITGQSTEVTTPPDITSQPSAVSVPAGGSCAFLVGASGFGLGYQWHRYGTNLVDGGNISGATSDMLIISPVSSTDVASGANGYSVTVSGAGGFSTNSITNSLTLRTAANLTWSGGANVWDLNTTPGWLSGGNPAAFNFGDTVTFNDTGIGNLTVNLTGRYLSAGSVTVNAGQFNDYVFSGSGDFAGPGQLVYIGGGHLTMNNANSYSGGTLISNATAYLVLNNFSALGTGPVTLAQAGGQIETTVAGGNSYGIKGEVIVADDFTITYDASSSYGAVLLGNLSGTAGKTLTINYNNSGTTPSRVRLYGASTVYDANLNLTDSRTVWAPYHGNGSQIYNGVISGSGALMQRGNGLTILSGANTYSGGTTPTTGAIGFGIDTVGAPDSGPIGTGPLFLAPEAPNLTGNGIVLAWGGARTIANPVQYPSGTNNLTLIIGGTNAMTFSGPITLNGNDGLGGPVNRIFQVTNTALTTFSGDISDLGSAGFGLTKTGSGTLALDGTGTYTGATTVSNGTLQVNGQLAVASAVTVWTNGILSGIGTIGGSVTVNAAGAIAPGKSIGNLNISGSLSLAGNLNIEVNKSASPNSDKVTVAGSLNNTGTGTVTVTNLGPALAQGDSFNLFNGKAVANGGALTIKGGGAIWNNKLAIDGSIEVQSVIATTPTNISYSLSDTNLTLSWPPDYLTWTLQSNAVSVVAPTNWYAVPNSSNVTSIVIPVYPSKANVFYRLVRP